MDFMILPMHVYGTTLADFHILSVKNLCRLCASGKCLSINKRNFFAMLVNTSLLNGGLYQMIFLQRLFLFPLASLFLLYTKLTLV